MPYSSRISSRPARPSPLSQVMNSKDIDRSMQRDHDIEEEEENLLADLELVVTRADSPLQFTPSEPALAAAPDCSTDSVVPKYWTASLPLQGETDEQFAAAAQRARTRVLKNKSFVHELSSRNHTLRGNECVPPPGHGTFPLATDTGDLTIQPECTQAECEIHDVGLSPALLLAMHGASILGRRIEMLTEKLDGEKDGGGRIRLFAERDMLKLQRGLRDAQVQVLYKLHLSMQDMDTF